VGERTELDQWYSTWGTRTPGDTRIHHRGYLKFKNIYNDNTRNIFVIKQLDSPFSHFKLIT
jgi:hypothetical protein